MNDDVDIKNLDQIVSDLDAFFREVPGHVYLKDIRGRWLFCNRELVKYAGFDSYKSMVGKTDYDMPWKAGADSMILVERQVLMLEREIKYSETFELVNGDLVQCITTKKPYYYNGELIGTIGNSIAHTKLRGTVDKLDYIDIQTGNILKLTAKQKTCLSNVIAGKTIKEAASNMKVSDRTVENHLYAARTVNKISSIRYLMHNVKAIYS